MKIAAVILIVVGLIVWLVRGAQAEYRAQKRESWNDKYGGAY